LSVNLKKNPGKSGQNQCVISNRYETIHLRRTEMSSITRKQIEYYFKGHSSIKIGWWLIILGTPLLFAGFGIIMILVGGYLLYKTYKLIPTDQQIDDFVNAELVLLKSRAIQKVGLDLVKLHDNGVTIRGFPTWKTLAQSGAQFFYKKGKDGVLRMTPFGAVLAATTDYQLFAYKCDFDLLTGNPLNEKVEEFFLKDIVSIRTETTTETYEIPKIGKVQSNVSEIFKVVSTGGDFFSLLINDPVILKAFSCRLLPPSHAEDAVSKIRGSVRNVKVGA